MGHSSSDSSGSPPYGSAGVPPGTGSYGTLGLLTDLEDADLDWMLSISVEQQVIASANVMVAGQVPEALHIVLTGLLEVLGPSGGGGVVARIGPGETVDAMPFLEEKPAPRTIRACEDSSLLAVPRKELEGRLQADPAFAARLYRSFAREVSRRLRSALARG